MAQTPGVRVLGVGNPGPHSAHHFFLRDCPASPAVTQPAQAVAEAAHVFLGQPPVPARQQHESEERGGFAVRKDHCLARMQAEPPPLQECADPSSPFFELFAVVVKQREIVDVAQVALRAKNFLAEVIQSIEIEVGEELAGQVADGQAAAAFQRCQEIVAGEQQVDRLLRVGAVDDTVGKVQRPFAGDTATEIGFENLVVGSSESGDICRSAGRADNSSGTSRSERWRGGFPCRAGLRSCRR